MRIVFDMNGIILDEITNDYWGQGENNTDYLYVQFKENAQSTTYINLSNYVVDVVVERPDGVTSPDLMMSIVTLDDTGTESQQGTNKAGKLAINSWITQVPGQLKMCVRMKQAVTVASVTTYNIMATGIFYRMLGQSISPADQTITDAQLQALEQSILSKEDKSNKKATLDATIKASDNFYPTTKLLWDRLKEACIPGPTLQVSATYPRFDVANNWTGIDMHNGLYQGKVAHSGDYSPYILSIVFDSTQNPLTPAESNAIFLCDDQIVYKYGNNVRLFNMSDITYLLYGTRYSLDTLSEILTTTNKSNIVAAINELKGKINNIVENYGDDLTAKWATKAYKDEEGNWITTQYAHSIGLAKFLADNDDSIIIGAYLHDTYDDQIGTGDDITIPQATEEKPGALGHNDKKILNNLENGSSNVVELKQGRTLNIKGTLNTTNGTVIVNQPTQNNHPANKQYVDYEIGFITDGTYLAKRAEKDSTGNYITSYYRGFDISVDGSTYVITLSMQDGTGAYTTKTIDLPLETMVVSGSYDSASKKIKLTLKNGNIIEFSVADLIGGLQSEITAQSKLSSDLVDDTNHTNKFVSASEKAQITTNANNITSLNTRVDNISYYSMVYSAGDESITIGGLALAYNEETEELSILR